MELITLEIFDNPIEAHMIKAKLESEGINCFLWDETMVSLYPLYNISVGGIKLKINRKDLQKSLEIVQAVNNAKLRDEQEGSIRCPKCDSDDIYNGFKSMKGIKGVLSAIISFFFLVYPLYYRSLYKCKSCGKEFE